MPKKTLFIISFLFLISFSLPVLAQPEIGDEQSFRIQANYDFSGRSEIEAILARKSLSAYWYVDKEWWDAFSKEEQLEADKVFESLISEFEINIYPTIRATFGLERSPGIDNDARITLLFHSMIAGAGGYNNTADGYLKIQLPESNEREMVYLNLDYFNTERMKSFIAHELVHLITFNQKEIINGVTEEVWLNEARAEYAPTLLGYDDNYQGSNLEDRVKGFLSKPSDSLTEWREGAADYGAVNLFIQYLVDHYSVGVLVDSLKSNKTGIESLNMALEKKGFEENFEQIFENWVIALLINNCQVDEKYCYFNNNLKNFRITPLMNYLPLIGESTLSVTNATKDWAGNWHKFVGGDGTLNINFNWLGTIGTDSIPYVAQYIDGRLVVGELSVNGFQGGKLTVPQFGSEIISLTIIPLSHVKISGFGNIEPSRIFSWSASTVETKEEEIPEIIPPSIVSLSRPISQMSDSEKDEIKNQLQEFISSLQGIACAINQDLYFGLQDNDQVKCLQEFLKSQGSDIYPEGFVTGNFFTITEQAVIRFQEKYANEILTSWGLTKGTGYVGSTTRNKINELLGN